ncbi:MAG: helix-turn-helix domain-containing protein [Gemmatimonadaceae bacterium]
MATATLDRRPRVLHNAKDYRTAVAAIDALLDRNAAKGTREYELLELFSLLVEDYETRHIPEPPIPTPEAVVDFMLEQRGMKRADLAAHFGGRSRVSDFFAGKRELSVGQIQTLRRLFGVSADLLLPPAD